MLTALQRLERAVDLRAAVVDTEAATDARKRAMAAKRAQALRALLLGRRSADVEDLDLFDPVGSMKAVQAAWNALDGAEPHERTTAASYLHIASHYLSHQGRVQGADADPMGLNRVLLDAKQTGWTPEYRREQFDRFATAGQDVHGLSKPVEQYRAEVAAIDAAEAEQRVKFGADLAAVLAPLEDLKQRAFNTFTDVEGGSITIEQGRELRRQYTAAYDEAMRALEERHKPVDDAHKERRRAAQAMLSAPAAELKRGMLDASPISAEQATAWAAAQTITPAAAARLRKLKYDPKQARADMAEFYRLSGGRLASVTLASKGQKRVNAEGIHGHDSSIINMGASFNKRVLFHELAHHLEADSVALAAAKAFLEKRRESEKLYRLRDLTGNNAYGPKEVAFKDSWFDAYVGKHYDNVTEVLSMGVESFCDDATLMNRIEADPEHMAFIAGFLRSKPHPLYAVAKKVRQQVSRGEADLQEVIEDEREAVLSRIVARASLVKQDPPPTIPWEYEKEGAYIGHIGDVEVFEVKKLRDHSTRRRRTGFILIRDVPGALGKVRRMRFDRAEALALAVIWPRLPGDQTGYINTQDPAKLREYEAAL